MSKTIIFFRHAVPNKNNFDLKKGVRFLGRRENPSIILPNKEEILHIKEELFESDIFFSSPMRRCIESMSLLTPKKIIETPLLLEVDYGDIDGMYLRDIQNKYGYLFDNWRKGEDTAFPNGENNLDVIIRIKKFIKNIKSLREDKIAVCTHNVFLRCLIGSSLEIPVKNWFKIEIPYFETIKFKLRGNKLEYIGSINQKNKLLKNLTPKHFDTYFIALLPDKSLYSKIYQTKKEIFQRFGNQKYLKNSPHCTLYFSLAEDLEEVRKRIEKISLIQKKINFNVLKEYIEFKGDKFAGGGTSLGLKFDKNANKKIILLQKKVIDSLNELRESGIHPRYILKDISRLLSDNINKYGFPFVGDVLIPHISFCCFDNQEKAEIFKKRYPIDNFVGNFNFANLALFKLYSDDKIKLIKVFELQ